MRRLKTLFFYAFIFLAISCNNETDEAPLIEKTARIEIAFEGSVEQYLVNFGVHSLYQGQSGFVSATIIQPVNLEWTQVIDEANTFNLSTSTNFTELVIESEEPVHTLGFNFNVVHTGDIPAEDFENLRATIKVFGDNAEVQNFQYTARPVGEVSEALSEVVRF
ncbi:MAG: hypothetical protein GYB55_25080 [Cytophagales bacterium]|uniref:hypothetical protein n=1 Tax=Cyclobacterium marinum TaxID=104 RepID=UPI0030DD8A40|nr:hypothetical protein [Cytophagales bacterium]|tara:strand:+ start:2866 stop:3357 length:492 start_codon:yes stop_codon:yes gene_type:complete